jgi:hypothetical protein
MIQKRALKSEDLKRDEERPNVCGDYYCVNSEPLSNYSFVNNAAVDLAFEMTEKTSEYPFFPGDLNACRSVDLLTEERKLMTRLVVG